MQKATLFFQRASVFSVSRIRFLAKNLVFLALLVLPAAFNTATASGDDYNIVVTPDFYVIVWKDEQSVTTTTTDYTYDELGRLKTATHPNDVTNEYEYDKADNRKSKESTSD